MIPPNSWHKNYSLYVNRFFELKFDKRGNFRMARGSERRGIVFTHFKRAGGLGKGVGGGGGGRVLQARLAFSFVL